MSNQSDTDQNNTDVQQELHAILVPGFWLGGWAWADVEPPLVAAGITTHAVTLPGLGTGETGGGDADGGGIDGAAVSSGEGVVLDDHVSAVLTLVDGLVGDVVLVGHSGGGAVVQGVIDRRPDRIRRVVYVDSGPLIDGASLMPDADGDLPLPSWDELAANNSSIEGMNDEALARFRAKAVDEPVGVARSKIRLSDERRHDVPASVICTSFPSEMLQQMIESGAIPSELGSVNDVSFVDLPTGHWPMFSRPADLAAVLREEILR